MRYLKIHMKPYLLIQDDDAPCPFDDACGLELRIWHGCLSSPTPCADETPEGVVGRVKRLVGTDEADALPVLKVGLTSHGLDVFHAWRLGEPISGDAWDTCFAGLITPVLEGADRLDVPDLEGWFDAARAVLADYDAWTNCDVWSLIDDAEHVCEATVYGSEHLMESLADQLGCKVSDIVEIDAETYDELCAQRRLSDDDLQLIHRLADRVRETGMDPDDAVLALRRALKKTRRRVMSRRHYVSSDDIDYICVCYHRPRPDLAERKPDDAAFAKACRSGDVWNVTVRCRHNGLAYRFEHIGEDTLEMAVLADVLERHGYPDETPDTIVARAKRVGLFIFEIESHRM